jgi:hypothetical protein
MNVNEAFESIGYLTMTLENKENPIENLFECLIASSIGRTTDKTTCIGVLDAIIVDFCNAFYDSRMAMWILRTEIAKACIDINNPSKDGIFRLIQYLAEAENEFLCENVINYNYKKRMNMAQGIKDSELRQGIETDFTALRPFL